MKPHKVVDARPHQIDPRAFPLRRMTRQRPVQVKQEDGARVCG